VEATILAGRAVCLPSDDERFGRGRLDTISDE
jgi:hypothetical protein